MFIYEDNINKKTCNELIKYYENSNKINIDDHKSKMTQVVINVLDSHLTNYIKQLNKILKKYMKKYTYVDIGQEAWTLHPNIKIQKYEPGESYFKWHCEVSGNKETIKRMLVFTTYLNDVKKGGETQFLYQRKKIKPLQGKTILFPPFWTHVHKGNKTTETKYIITGWYTYVH